MSLASCPKCWDTPCTCGHEYQNWPREELDKLIQVLQTIRNKKYGNKLEADPYQYKDKGEDEY